jgi:hypothetical protein
LFLNADKLYTLVQNGKNGFEKHLGYADEVIACIHQDVLELIDMRTSLAELKEHDIDRYENIMTREGNCFVASTLWESVNPQVFKASLIEYLGPVLTEVLHTNCFTQSPFLQCNGYRN